MFAVVVAAGFEPTTSSESGKRSNQIEPYDHIVMISSISSYFKDVKKICSMDPNILIFVFLVNEHLGPLIILLKVKICFNHAPSGRA